MSLDVIAGDDAAESQRTPLTVSVVDALVTRLHAEYGVDRDELRAQADEALAVFASARVQAFVPILVEKRLRNAYRGRPQEAL
jgi:hypothetical protein